MKINGKWIKDSIAYYPKLSKPYFAQTEYERKYSKSFRTKEEAIRYLTQLHREHGSPRPKTTGRPVTTKSYGFGKTQLAALLRAFSPISNENSKERNK